MQTGWEYDAKIGFQTSRCVPGLFRDSSGHPPSIGFSNKTTKDLIKPYYTTKEKGSGLGLSIVDKIINDHNGSINFNTIKQGAKVEINLPKNN